jgi:hypothetical protein
MNERGEVMTSMSSAPVELKNYSHEIDAMKGLVHYVSTQFSASIKTFE